MPVNYVRKSGSRNLRGVRMEENLKNVIKGTEVNETGVTAAFRYCRIPSRTVRSTKPPGILTKLSLGLRSVSITTTTKRDK
jgi:hypothetical protein